MRILQLHNSYRQPGGEDEVVAAEATVLETAGHQVRQHLVQNPDSNMLSAANLVLSPWNPIAMKRVAEVVENFRPDVAHVHNTWFAMSPGVIHSLKKLEVPVVMTLHNYRLTCANGLLFRDGAPCVLCVGSHSWHSVRYGCYRNSHAQSVPAAATIALHQRLGTWTNSVDTFIALTEFQRELMIRAGLPPEKISVKPNFVPDPGHRPAPPSKSNIVLFVGRLSKEKGIQLLVDAWQKLDHSDLELVIVGDGPERHFLEQEHASNMRLAGFLPPEEVRQVMLSARALVMPSLWPETMGMVMVEAFAAGLPVVVSEGGPPAHIVGDALGPGWIFRSGDPVSLMGTLKDTTRNDSWCDSAGELARHAFEANFGESLGAERLVHVYESVLSKSGQKFASDTLKCEDAPEAGV